MRLEGFISKSRWFASPSLHLLLTNKRRFCGADAVTIFDACIEATTSSMQEAIKKIGIICDSGDHKTSWVNIWLEDIQLMKNVLLNRENCVLHKQGKTIAKGQLHWCEFASFHVDDQAFDVREWGFLSHRFKLEKVEGDEKVKEDKKVEEVKEDKKDEADEEEYIVAFQNPL